MQIKCSDGSVMVAGMLTRDADYKEVGEKKTPLTKLGAAVGKRPDTTTIFCDLAAWRGLAKATAAAKKGEAVFAVGQVESREYEGKTYNTLNWEYISVVSAKPDSAAAFLAGVEKLSAGAPVDVDFTELNDDDGDLPF